MDTKEADTDAGSTTVSDNNNMVYDQIFISQGVFYEFGDAQASLDSNIGIVDFDNELPYSDLDFHTIKDLVSDHRPIYAKFRYDLGDDDGLGTGIDSNIRPSEIKLGNSYPNPFNPVTTIEYSLPEDTHVTLSVYNLKGQTVQVLRDEYHKAGKYSLKWNARGFSSGLYFYSLKANEFTETRKMLLVK